MSLVPRWQSRLPSLFGKRTSDLFNLGKFFDDLEEEFSSLNYTRGLSVSADDQNIYIEADVPGLTAKDVDVSIDNQGVLWIKGDREFEEKEDKKYYRKSHHSFSYCLPLWDEIDVTQEPKAICKNGVMTLTFKKRIDKRAEAKKIPVKEEK